MILKLGPVSVVVEFTEQLDEKFGKADYANSRILIAKGQDAQMAMLTLLHEALHFLDYHMLGERLLGGEPDHPLIDQLATALHMMLKDNWPVWRELYDAFEGKGKRR